MLKHLFTLVNKYGTTDIVNDDFKTMFESLSIDMRLIWVKVAYLKLVVVGANLLECSSIITDQRPLMQIAYNNVRRSILSLWNSRMLKHPFTLVNEYGTTNIANDDFKTMFESLSVDMRLRWVKVAYRKLAIVASLLQCLSIITNQRPLMQIAHNNVRRLINSLWNSRLLKQPFTLVNKYDTIDIANDDFKTMFESLSVDMRLRWVKVAYRTLAISANLLECSSIITDQRL
ncbi:hypothetical protein LWI28_005750 [Acer negundo]|uniref:Uncharacterized protein n=1 Tax=Acer negundo TaxID=4023 RepID=A0AAD5IXQ3_ACENE|nr:hypothetical protein LWI28_005750 [Acer negundo]